MECSDPGQWIELGRQDCSSFRGLAAGGALTEDLTAAASESASIPLLATAVAPSGGSSTNNLKESIGRGHQLGACALAGTEVEVDVENDGDEGGLQFTSVKPWSQPNRQADEKGANDGYDPRIVQEQLLALKMEGKTLQTAADAVKDVFIQHGIVMVKASTQKQGNRPYKIFMRCQRGMPNRQKDRDRVSKTGSPNVPARRAESRRTGCKCQVWILHPQRDGHPKLSGMKLEHEHPIKKEAFETTLTCKAPWNAPEFFHEVVRATVDGMYKKRQNSAGRLTHIFWMTREQITLATRYGTVTTYDDTAVKKRYRAPLGMFVVIDGDYNSRLVAQSVTEDTTTDTFVWMLEAYREAMGKAPEVFIQDADKALTEAVLQVYPRAVLKRCVWHLNQSLDKNLGPIVRDGMKELMVMFSATRTQASLQDFEAHFDAIVKRFPAAVKYLLTVYEDRKRWAEYSTPLLFTVGSPATLRVECEISLLEKYADDLGRPADFTLSAQNAAIAQLCNSKSSVLDIFKCFSTLLTRQTVTSALRNAELELPCASLPVTTDAYFRDVVEGIKFAIGGWPARFMEEEMGAAVQWCLLGSGILEGVEKAQALKAFEYIGEKLVRVTAVASVIERRSQEKVDPYTVLRFHDGSHLCSCRTLQKLGLFCRHAFAAMLQSKSFGFHVGLVHEHWLGQRARETPQANWPETGQAKWILAGVHGGAKGSVDEFPEPSSISWQDWDSVDGGTCQTIFRDMNEHGPRERERRIVHTDLNAMFRECSYILSDTMTPAEARLVGENFLLEVRRLGSERRGQIDSHLVLGNMSTIRLPSFAGSKRKQPAVEQARPDGPTRR